MKKLNIFKPGRHTDAHGTVADFTEDAIRASALAYNPAIHEAPIVVGHPKDNLPAYGWVQGLEFSEDSGLEAIPHQVDTDFAELVAAGRFKKISASFYMPESPANPVPGTYYLRHVGFLGAQPPAIKGLRDAEFNENEDGVVEFMAAYDESTNASLWRRLREWLIGTAGIETADQVVPDYAVQDLEAGARNSIEAPASQPVAAFNETGADTMTEEELRAAAAQLEADRAALTADQASFEEQQAATTTREQAVAAREQAIAGQANADFVEGLIKDGKVLPAQKAGLIAMLNKMDAGQELEFGEGDAAVKTTDSAFFREYLKAQPKLVDFQERSSTEHGEAEGESTDPVEISRQIEAERKRVKNETGRDISFAEAAHSLKKATK